MARKKIERDDLMQQTRAAVCLVNSSAIDPMNAFLAIMHPEISEEKRLEIVRAARSK